MNHPAPARTLVTLLLVLGVGPGAASLAGAQSQTHTQTQTQPHVASPAQATPAENGPVVELGFEHRFRTETSNNIFDFDDTRDDRRNHFRFRTRLWVRALFGDRVEVYGGLNNESRSVTTPNQPTVLDEIIVEHLYADWKINERHSLRAGRQNVMRGEGFALFDANPLDGSRSAYFNALLFTRTFGTTSTIELIAIDNPSRDRHLPRINDSQHLLVEWDERAFGTYVTERRIARTQLDGYYLHKTERNDYRGPAHRQFHPDRSLEIVGGRAVREFGHGVTFAGEFSREWGRLTGRDTAIRAWGGYGYVKKAWPVAWKPTLQAGYVGMSGDNPDTATFEEWHPVFARWPKWSELYIYSQAQERGPGYWANLGMYLAEVTASPAKPIGLRMTYYKLHAFHPFPGPTSVFGPGTNRGQLVEARLDVTLNNSLRGHVLYEGLWPGDFTRGLSKGYFFRTELTCTFRRGFGTR